MILIADSGSTKTDWCVVLNGAVIKRLGTKGINPFFQSEKKNQQKLTELPFCLNCQRKGNSMQFTSTEQVVHPRKAPVLRRAIADSLPVIGNIKANSDMLAAAPGYVARRLGIACILGTGSNSCFYNGKEIVSNISPLGFILGDEGSGAVLGKLLVGDILKNQLPATLKERVSAVRSDASRNHRPGLSPALSQSFLASLSPFILASIWKNRLSAN